ncbi:MAG: serine protease [Planctomycetes bacterium]|nr:serine protease [Planctomycetota bacterium]
MAKIGTVLITASLLLWQSAFAQPKPPSTDQAPAEKKTADISEKKRETKSSPKKATSPAEVKACMITISGMIDNGLYKSLQRRTQEAKDDGRTLIFYRIDTFGGTLAAAFDICDYLSDLKGVKTVAYIPRKAISAGSMIAMACNEIVMVPGSLLGDCEPIIPNAEKGMITAPEKMQTVLRARFRAMAERNGYPVELAEALVTKEMEVYQVTLGDVTKYMTKSDLDELTEKEKDRITRKKLVVEKDRLLTMHDKEAKEYGFAKAIVKSDQELYDLYHVRGTQVPLFDPNWSEELVRFLDSIAPVLLVIGLIALYIELKVPGFGLPGILAIACFATLFISKYLIGLAENWEVLIFILGLALLAVEVFVLPGFGIAGVTGLLLIAVALVLSFQPFVIPRTPFEVEMTKSALLKVLGSVVASVIGMCILARYLPETSIFSRIILKSAQSPGTGYVVASAERQDLVGKEGVSVSNLRPVGRAEIGDEVLSVVTLGEMVEKGRKIRVLEVKGNRVVVREI